MTGARGPSVQTYLDWARANRCTVRVTPVVRDGRRLQAVVICAPSGATVCEIVSESDDPLMSSTIARLDRRLGLKSYLFR